LRSNERQEDGNERVGEGDREGSAVRSNAAGRTEQERVQDRIVGWKKN
jgi:hypothetical protein